MTPISSSRSSVSSSSSTNILPIDNGEMRGPNLDDDQISQLFRSLQIKPSTTIPNQDVPKLTTYSQNILINALGNIAQKQTAAKILTLHLSQKQLSTFAQELINKWETSSDIDKAQQSISTIIIVFVQQDKLSSLDPKTLLQLITCLSDIILFEACPLQRLHATSCLLRVLSYLKKINLSDIPFSAPLKKVLTENKLPEIAQRLLCFFLDNTTLEITLAVKSTRQILNQRIPSNIPEEIKKTLIPYLLPGTCDDICTLLEQLYIAYEVPFPATADIQHIMPKIKPKDNRLNLLINSLLRPLQQTKGRDIQNICQALANIVIYIGSIDENTQFTEKNPLWIKFKEIIGIGLTQSVNGNTQHNILFELIRMYRSLYFHQSNQTIYKTLGEMIKYHPHSHLYTQHYKQEQSHPSSLIQYICPHNEGLQEAVQVCSALLTICNTRSANPNPTLLYDQKLAAQCLSQFIAISCIGWDTQEMRPIFASLARICAYKSTINSDIETQDVHVLLTSMSNPQIISSVKAPLFFGMYKIILFSNSFEQKQKAIDILEQEPQGSFIFKPLIEQLLRKKTHENCILLSRIGKHHENPLKTAKEIGKQIADASLLKDIFPQICTQLLKLCTDRSQAEFCMAILKEVILYANDKNRCNEKHIEDAIAIHEFFMVTTRMLHLLDTQAFDDKRELVDWIIDLKNPYPQTALGLLAASLTIISIRNHQDHINNTIKKVSSSLPKSPRIHQQLCELMHNYPKITEGLFRIFIYGKDTDARTMAAQIMLSMNEKSRLPTIAQYSLYNCLVSIITDPGNILSTQRLVAQEKLIEIFHRFSFTTTTITKEYWLDLWQLIIKQMDRCIKQNSLYEKPILASLCKQLDSCANFIQTMQPQEQIDNLAKTMCHVIETMANYPTITDCCITQLANILSSKCSHSVKQGTYDTIELIERQQNQQLIPCYIQWGESAVAHLLDVGVSYIPRIISHIQYTSELFWIQKTNSPDLQSRFFKQLQTLYTICINHDEQTASNEIAQIIVRPNFPSETFSSSQELVQMGESWYAAATCVISHCQNPAMIQNMAETTHYYAPKYADWALLKTLFAIKKQDPLLEEQIKKQIAQLVFSNCKKAELQKDLFIQFIHKMDQDIFNSLSPHEQQKLVSTFMNVVPHQTIEPSTLTDIHKKIADKITLDTVKNTNPYLYMYVCTKTSIANSKIQNILGPQTQELLLGIQWWLGCIEYIIKETPISDEEKCAWVQALGTNPNDVQNHLIKLSQQPDQSMYTQSTPPKEIQEPPPFHNKQTALDMLKDLETKIIELLSTRAPNTDTPPLVFPQKEAKVWAVVNAISCLSMNIQLRPDSPANSQQQQKAVLDPEILRTEQQSSLFFNYIIDYFQKWPEQVASPGAVVTTEMRQIFCHMLEALQDMLHDQHSTQDSSLKEKRSSAALKTLFRITHHIPQQAYSNWEKTIVCLLHEEKDTFNYRTAIINLYEAANKPHQKDMSLLLQKILKQQFERIDLWIAQESNLAQKDLHQKLCPADWANLRFYLSQTTEIEQQICADRLLSYISQQESPIPWKVFAVIMQIQPLHQYQKDLTKQLFSHCNLQSMDDFTRYHDESDIEQYEKDEHAFNMLLQSIEGTVCQK